MPLTPQFGDSENNLIAKIAINTGPNMPLKGDGRWNLLYKVAQNTYESATSADGKVPAGGTTNQVLTKNSDNNYDIVWKDIGIGPQYIDGEVATYNDLPIAIGVPPIDSAYLVREASGVWIIGRHPAGVYIRTANTGALTDWTYAGILPDVFSDANFAIYNIVDSSKQMKFDASTISPNTTRTLIAPDSNGTIALAENVVAKSGDTMTGKLIAAATLSGSKLNIGSAIGGASPSSFVGGDLWLSNQNKLTVASSASNTVILAGINQSNTFNNTQTISASTSATMLSASNTGTGAAAVFNAQGSATAVRITQTGSGESFRVEDESNPDSTAFVISNSGRVGVGVTPDTTVCLSVDSTGIKFSDGTILTTAAKIGQEVRSDFVTDTSYIGIAPNGSAESASVWTIYRNIIDSDGNITSTTVATNVAWDDRTTATYA
jgi:hypothetical protein